MKITVNEQHSAIALGSGTLPVLGTPALIAFMEAAAQQEVKDLTDEETTVGTVMNCQHLKATAIGEDIWCTAKIAEIDGRKISFDIEARNAQGDLIGTAKHERFIVNKQRFMSKLS